MNQSHYTFKTSTGNHSGWYDSWADVLADYPTAILLNQTS